MLQLSLALTSQPVASLVTITRHSDTLGHTRTRGKEE